MIEVSFECREQDITLWTEIFDGLADGELGAVFQDKMDVFGEKVTEKLEELMDDEDFGPEAFYVDGWSHDDSEFSVEFASPDPYFQKELKKLFSLCPVKALVVEDIEE